jgi:signal transduction histidine kinase
MQQTARIWPLMNDGAVCGTITSIEDVSERVVREAELSLAREQAEDANQAKDKLLATLSHDLRTPLSSILGWIRLMQKAPGDAVLMSRAMKSIESNTMLQVQLIDQILDTSRIASGKIEISLEEADLSAVTNTAIDAIVPLAESKEIRIQREVPPGPAILCLDPKRIHQIVWNLLSNAVKFTPDGGTVHVSLLLSEAGAKLKVTDTGMGIGEDDLDHIFEPLWQSEQAGGHGGLGLGLSIAKQLAELHGGSIRAESGGPGQGATFTLELPQRDVRNTDDLDPDIQRCEGLGRPTR